MTEAKLAPNLPDWQVQHANRYLASGGTEGHMYKTRRAGTGRDHGAGAASDHHRPQVRREVHISAVLRNGRRQLHFVVASKGGAPEHPGWYRNLLANPDVEVQVGTKKLKARARTATGDERARLWKKALEFWPPYADYALKTEREIPVVVLDPVH